MTKFLNISTDSTLGGNSPADDVVVSQKAISTAVATKQDTLISGSNIKTVNGNSLLGSGDITISGGVAWGNITGTLTNQTDLNTALSGKQATITGAASSVVANNLAAARAVITDGSGKLAASSTTSTEIGYVSGVTSAIQTQLNNKQATLTAGNGIDITSNVISVGDIDCGTLS